MQTVKCGFLDRNTVTLYDDPDNLPVGNYSLWNKYQLIDSSIGSGLKDLDEKHLKNLYALAQEGNKDKITEELNNFRQLFDFIGQAVLPNQLSFACLVHSINGREFKDYSETGLKEILIELNKAGFTQAALKKKARKSAFTFISKLMQCFRRFMQTITHRKNSTTTS
jgi:hypothetical protein